MATEHVSHDSLRSTIETIARARRQFEADWREGRHPRIEAVAETAAEELRAAVIVELAAVEYELRVEAGEEPRIPEYQARFPELASQIHERLSHPLDSTVVLARPLPRWLQAGEMVGRYRLLSRLGRGGFGEVWLAHDPVLDREVAVKTLRVDRPLHPEFNHSLVSEGQKLAKLTHPGIVRVLDAGVEEGRAYLVSEVMRGGSLLDRIRSNEPIPTETAVRWVIEISHAVQFAHERGFVHRDLKPGNVLFDHEGKLHVCDFGLSASEFDQLSEDAEMLGTWGYVPPEQAQGKSRYADPRSDVYSIGAILYVLLTGRLPFVATTVEQYRTQLLEREPRPLRAINSSISGALEAVCLRCLSKSPGARPATALELAEALEACLDADAGNSRLPAPRRMSLARTRLAWALGGGACLLILGVSVNSALTLAPSGSLPPPEIPSPAPEMPDWASPRIVTWGTDSDLAGRLGYNAEARHYVFDGVGGSLFEVGEAQGQALRLTGTFRIPGDKQLGRAGLFWTLTRREQEGAQSCWLVCVGRLSEKSRHTLQVRELNLNVVNGRTTILQDRLVASEPMEPLPPEFVLECDVAAGEVQRVALDGVERLGATPLPERDWNLFETGGYGFYGRGATISLQDFSAGPVK